MFGLSMSNLGTHDSFSWFWLSIKNLASLEKKFFFFLLFLGYDEPLLTENGGLDVRSLIIALMQSLRADYIQVFEHVLVSVISSDACAILGDEISDKYNESKRREQWRSQEFLLVGANN